MRKGSSTTSDDDTMEVGKDLNQDPMTRKAGSSEELGSRKKCCIYIGVLVSASVFVSCLSIGFYNVYRYNGMLYVSLLALVALVMFISLCVENRKKSNVSRLVRRFLAHHFTSSAISLVRFSATTHVPSNSRTTSPPIEHLGTRVRLASLLSIRKNTNFDRTKRISWNTCKQSEGGRTSVGHAPANQVKRTTSVPTVVMTGIKDHGVGDFCLLGTNAILHQTVGDML